jgi:hypothetical protein
MRRVVINRRGGEAAMPRIPKPAKPAEQLRRRNRPEAWTVLPAAGCTLAVPKWPHGTPTATEKVLWTTLWKLPIACWWHEQRSPLTVVARYVSLRLEKPEHATVGKLEVELGLTPAAMLRMRLVVEQPEPEVAPFVDDPYKHLRSVA